jgi:ubiquitin-activating enzyme E1
MKFSKLVEFVSKKAIPPHVKHLVVEVMVSDEEDEDVEVFTLHPRLISNTN